MTNFRKTKKTEMVIAHNNLDKSLPFNCTVCDENFYGNIVFIGVETSEGKNGKNTSVCTDLALDLFEFKKHFPQLWEN